jgi:hypothetical protein
MKVPTAFKNGNGLAKNKVKRFSLGEGYKLRDIDVLCCVNTREAAKDHPGNKAWSIEIMAVLGEFERNNDRVRRSHILFEVVGRMRSRGARFVEISCDKYYEVGDRLARNKGKWRSARCRCNPGRVDAAMCCGIYSTVSAIRCILPPLTLLSCVCFSLDIPRRIF